MIITACDKNYLSEAEVLIKSCARQEPNQRFYLYLVEGTPDQVLIVKSWHPNIIVERVSWPYQELRSGMINCVRSMVLEKVLETYSEPTLYLDSDMIVRSGLAELFSLLEIYDLTVLFRPQLEHIGVAGTPYANKFNSGVIGIRPSPVGKYFARMYNEALKSFINSGNPIVRFSDEYGINVWADQEFLYVTYKELKDKLQFKSLPSKFNDSKFNNNSIIWHGKGTARNHPSFVIEKKRYTQEFFYHPLGMVNWILWRLRQLKKQLK